MLNVMTLSRTAPRRKGKGRVMARTHVAHYRQRPRYRILQMVIWLAAATQPERFINKQRSVMTWNSIGVVLEHETGITRTTIRGIVSEKRRPSVELLIAFWRLLGGNLADWLYMGGFIDAPDLEHQRKAGPAQVSTDIVYGLFRGLSETHRLPSDEGIPEIEMDDLMAQLRPRIDEFGTDPIQRSCLMAGTHSFNLDLEGELLARDGDGGIAPDEVGE